MFEHQHYAIYLWGLLTYSLYYVCVCAIFSIQINICHIADCSPLLLFGSSAFCAWQQGHTHISTLPFWRPSSHSNMQVWSEQSRVQYSLESTLCYVQRMRNYFYLPLEYQTCCWRCIYYIEVYYCFGLGFTELIFYLRPSRGSTVGIKVLHYSDIST